jgi:folate-binding protein YgfZ
MLSLTYLIRRLLLLVPAARLDTWLRRLPLVAQVDPGVWWWSQVDAAIPAVFATTRELFVPQTLNLEVLGGVSFRKGCYPGQEVVARSQYLGKLRRRMGLAHTAQVGPAADIFHSGQSNPVGRIVMAAKAPDSAWDLLFECPIELTEYGSLHAGDRDAPALTLRPLPYRIFDPTE